LHLDTNCPVKPITLARCDGQQLGDLFNLLIREALKINRDVLSVGHAIGNDRLAPLITFFDRDAQDAYRLTVRLAAESLRCVFGRNLASTVDRKFVFVLGCWSERL
jgi:hypothetical protein